MLEPFYGAKDAADEHHDAGGVEDVTRYFHVCWEMVTSATAVFHQRDEGQEAQFHDGLEQEARFDEIEAIAHSARVIGIGSDGGCACRRQSFDRAAEEEKSA